MSDTTALAVWDPNSGAPLPAHLAALGEEFGSNIADRMSVPSLSYEGKTWQIIANGNRQKLERQNSDGDMEPIPIMRAIVLNYNNARGRAYYEGTYNPAASSAPKCWSADGDKPDESVKEKQNPVCNGCPMSIKGSKIVDGREMVACSAHRMLAVQPAFDLNCDPLRLKIAVTSDYDKDIVEHGWFAFRQYTDYLKSRSVAHTAMVVTKIKFDPNVAYPKLLFALDRPLSPEEVAPVRLCINNPKVEGLLAEKWTAAGSAGKLKAESDIAPYGLERAYADGWQPHPDNALYSFKGAEVITNEVLAARYPQPEPEVSIAPAIPASELTIEVPVVEVAPALPAAEAPALTGIDAAVADGWAVHPDNPSYYFKDQEVVKEEDLAGRYPTAAAAPAPEPTPAPAAPPVPAASPSEPAAPAHDPLAAATADGWLPHPDSEGWWYKEQEVVATDDLAGRYPPVSGGTPAAPAGSESAATAAAPAPASSGTTATSVASPSDGELPADVADILGKWTEPTG